MSQEFQGYLEEQLARLPGLRFKRMFGGHGIYADDLFFGILHGDCLYFKTNEASRQRYLTAGSGPFITPGQGIALKNYYEVPPEIIERADELLEWALESIKNTAEY